MALKTKKVVSLFSGAGGMDIGFEQAGFEIAVAVEKDPSCCKTLRTNRPHLTVIEGDITKISTQEILNAGKINPLEAALVIGGPPCQSFSLAGKRMGMDDPRGQLLLEFIRVVRECLPVAFVMENVKGMQTWQQGAAIKAIFHEMMLPINHNGQPYHYTITHKTLNAANFGAPQFRERIFIVGNRIDKPFVFPEPTHGQPEQKQLNMFPNYKKIYKTVWDAIGTLPPAQEPSKTALRVSQTIKARREKHGY